MKDTKTASELSFVSQYFGLLEDPRGSQGQLHEFNDILSISILAVICGADDFTEIALWGKANQEWLKELLVLRNGIPSHDTFDRVFVNLDSEAFERCFIGWVKHLCEEVEGVIPIDGKMLRGSHDAPNGKQAIWLVSAWSSANGLVLGQLKVDEKSNEITAIPKLLDLLEVRGSTVTIDAMGCQVEIAEKIIVKEADYILSLKGNQSELHQQVQESFKRIPSQKLSDKSEKYDLGHGRLEFRNCYVTDDLGWLSADVRQRWEEAGLKSLIKLHSIRIQNHRGEEITQSEIRYFITSHEPHADKLLDAVRKHWQVENQLHWMLDVCFKEDHARLRKGNAGENFSALRRLVINLLKKEPSKMSMKNKRKKAGWDQAFLLKILKS